MIRPAALGAALAALTAAPLAAQTASQNEVDRFLAAVAQVECRLDARTAPAVQQATGFSDETLSNIMITLYEAGGVAQEQDGTVVVTAGPCER